jgi:hypothetical protein
MMNDPQWQQGLIFGDPGEPGSQRCRQDWDLIG